MWSTGRVDGSTPSGLGASKYGLGNVVLTPRLYKIDKFSRANSLFYRETAYKTKSSVSGSFSPPFGGGLAERRFLLTTNGLSSSSSTGNLGAGALAFAFPLAFDRGGVRGSAGIGELESLLDSRRSWITSLSDVRKGDGERLEVACMAASPVISSAPVCI
jgi:hypothetical protein